jgi:hypothetical protein
VAPWVGAANANPSFNGCVQFRWQGAAAHYDLIFFF